jgi:hypothetical protein
MKRTANYFSVWAGHKPGVDLTQVSLTKDLADAQECMKKWLQMYSGEGCEVLVKQGASVVESHVS